MYLQPEAVVGVALLPGVTGHQCQLVQLGDGHVVVQVGLEGVVVAKVGVAVSRSVVSIVGNELSVVRVVRAVGTLAVVEGVVGIPVESLNNLQGSLGDDLVTLPGGLRGILVDERHGVVVGRAFAHHPSAVGILYAVCGIEVVHGVEHRCAGVAHRHAYVLAIHGIQAYRQVETVLQHLGRYQRAQVQAVHVRALDDALTVHIVERSHILGLGRAAGDRQVVVMADTRAEHLVLPVGIAVLVVGIVDIVAADVAADIVGRGHVEGLGNLVEGHVAVVAHVGALGLAAALGGDDDHTVGGLRAVDGRGRGVAEHVNRLDVIGGHHRDVHAGNTVDDIVGLHGSALTQ